MTPRLLSRAQAAAYLGISPTQLDAEVRAGTFPPPFPLAQIRAIAPREIHRLLDLLEIAVVNSRPSRVNPARVRALHRQRLTDAQIGERLGVTGSAVLYWRRRLMLPAWR